MRYSALAGTFAAVAGMLGKVRSTPAHRHAHDVKRSFFQRHVRIILIHLAYRGALAYDLPQFGVDGETSAMQYLQTLCDASQQHASSMLISCVMIATIVRVASIALMLGSNAVMLNFFVKGLHETDSLTATVTSASVNFMLSAAGGYFFFHEHLPLQWFVGATLILIGMGCLLHGDSSDPLTSHTDTKAKQS